jgi:transposase
VLTAVILGEVGDVQRFPSKAHFASYTGTAPIDVSSGDQLRHRLNRGGNRRLNYALHIAALVQVRLPGSVLDYYLRKGAAGKTPLEAMRCPKRRLSDVVFRALLADSSRPGKRARQDTRGRLCSPARLTQPQRSALRTSHFPDPPPATLRHQR